jgi:hypothetical protein
MWAQTVRECSPPRRACAFIFVAAGRGLSLRINQPQNNGVAALRAAVAAFVDLYNEQWLPEKNGFLSPVARPEVW